MSVLYEILRTLGRIEGELVEIRKLNQRVRHLEMWQSRLKGGWAAMMALYAYLLRRFALVILTIPLLFLVSACATHYITHPGALNKTDSVAYDALLIAETTIDQARLELQAGKLPAEAKGALQELIRVYNVAREAWLTYRGALATNAESSVYFDRLTQNLSDLTNAIRKFEEANR
jgi:hypothetical protein